MDDTAYKQLLEQTRTIAVIGAKDRIGQPVDNVGRYLIKAGYTVIPVHPTRQQVWGLTTYPTLGDVPCAVDLVNVFRAPAFCAAHAREVLALASRPSAFWMQLGIQNQEARTLLENAGVMVIEDKCLAVEHARLCGRAFAASGDAFTIPAYRQKS